MSVDYFDDRIAYTEKTMDDRLRKLREQPDVYTKPEIFHHANFRDSYQLIFLDYSRGEDIAALKGRFAPVVPAWERYLAAPRAESNDFAAIDDYVRSLWLLSFALLFEVEPLLLDRVLKCIGNEGKDLLFERLVSTRVSGRPAGEKLLWPRPYQPLYQVIDAAEAEKPKLMQKFLKTWYNSLRRCYWHDCHKGPQGGGFFGYWSIEAAGVVKAFGTADQSFRNMPYYPRALV
jgi:hypothetical protein